MQQVDQCVLNCPTVPAIHFSNAEQIARKIKIFLRTFVAITQKRLGRFSSKFHSLCRFLCSFDWCTPFQGNPKLVFFNFFDPQKGNCYLKVARTLIEWLALKLPLLSRLCMDWPAIFTRHSLNCPMPPGHAKTALSHNLLSEIPEKREMLIKFTRSRRPKTQNLTIHWFLPISCPTDLYPEAKPKTTR